LVLKFVPFQCSPLMIVHCKSQTTNTTVNLSMSLWDYRILSLNTQQMTWIQTTITEKSNKGFQTYGNWSDTIMWRHYYCKGPEGIQDALVLRPRHSKVCTLQRRREWNENGRGEMGTETERDDEELVGWNFESLKEIRTQGRSTSLLYECWHSHRPCLVQTTGDKESPKWAFVREFIFTGYLATVGDFERSSKMIVDF